MLSWEAEEADDSPILAGNFVYGGPETLEVRSLLIGQKPSTLYFWFMASQLNSVTQK